MSTDWGIREGSVRDQKDCEHERCEVEFDLEKTRNLSASEVRRMYPRFQGACPDCGYTLIKYASLAHYVAGDW